MIASNATQLRDLEDALRPVDGQINVRSDTLGSAFKDFLSRYYFAQGDVLQIDGAVIKRDDAAGVMHISGRSSIFEIPKQLTPDVDPPVVTVSTFWSGASPQEIASEIVERQEEKLKNITGLRKMTSSSIEGSATVSQSDCATITFQEFISGLFNDL